MTNPWAHRLACTAALFLAFPAEAQVPFDEIGQVATLPSPLQSHWVWVTDALTERSALVDLDTGRLLGMVDGGWGLTTLVFSARRNEFYVPETHYSRRSRGTRTDVLTFYDALTLAPTGEVILPSKRAINPLPSANATLLDDDRFVAVFNMTPAASVSIVDVLGRRFIAEIQTPGCGLVYAAGPRRFVMLCGDGAMLVVRLDETGHEAEKTRTEPFFDPQKDPVTEKAVRFGDRWIFVSFEGFVHVVDVSGETPRFEEPWSLFNEADHAASWRIGGRQHLEVHPETGRLFSLVHQGKPDTHKSGATQLWIYDLSSHARLQRIRLHSPGFTFMGFPMEFGQDWIWPFNQLYGWIADQTVEYLGVASVQITRGAKPLLVTSAPFSGSLAIYDAITGKFLRRVVTSNTTTMTVQTPPWPPGEAHNAGKSGS